MIEQAKKGGHTSKSGVDVQFFVGQAETCNAVAPIEKHSVDMVTAAMAVCTATYASLSFTLSDLHTQAHWFDMEKFWKTMSEILRPGGTVALWTCSSLFCRQLLHDVKGLSKR